MAAEAARVQNGNISVDGENLYKAETVYCVSLLGMLNRWLKENETRWARVPTEDVLEEALEFLIKFAPVT